MGELTGRTVLVTGATSGFGEAIARRLAGEGVRQVLVGRRRQRLETLCEELGGSAHALALDVRDRAAVVQGLASLPLEFQEISVLINSAGLSLGFGPAQVNDLSDWDVMVDTNVKGVLACIHGVLPGMVQRNCGHIVNLGSIAANYPYLGGNVYAATKAFIHHLSLCLRADLMGTDVKVTCIEPGMAETEFALVRFKGDVDRAKAFYDGICTLEPANIAEAVLWCLLQPAHVNVNMIELMPVNQAFGLGLRPAVAAPAALEPEAERYSG